MTTIFAIALTVVLVLACLFLRKAAVRIGSIAILAVYGFYVAFVEAGGLRQIVFEKIQQRSITSDFADGVGFCNNFMVPYLWQLVILVIGIGLVGVISNLRRRD